MTQEVELIVGAIESLQSQPNYVKDYAFPIASALFTSLLGAGIAFLTIKHQDTLRYEREKVSIANKWSLLAEEARATLIAVKSNYHGKLTDVPAQRLVAVPSVLFHANQIIERYEELSFLVCKGENAKWGQIPRIRSMFQNYNYLLELWKQRNDFERPLREKIMNGLAHGRAYTTVNQAEIIGCIGESDFCQLVDLTEQVIKLTDDILVELDDFMMNFPPHAKSQINYESVKKHTRLIRHSNNGNQKLLMLLHKEIHADFSTVEHIFGMPAQDIETMYNTGYEE